ncbi:hypothetical protein TSUD_141840 [Trifolium subterraneum]|uniref:DYW domain-containing protein n=1 Tax=Trifolium subterraneum TaxID=3900 RepID=A0A2Z6M1K4_TRISU|nr:hypothetical protein TSUD_141840 [Trifolium subterraneum]
MRRCLKREEASILLINLQRHRRIQSCHYYISHPPPPSPCDSSSDAPQLARYYISRNEIKLARHVFDQIPKPSVVLWNMMIRAYAWAGPFQQSIHLYLHMLHLGVTPTKFTFPFVLKACSSLQALQLGRLIHNHAHLLGLSMDVYVSTALLDMYAKCGNLFEAQTLFNTMSHMDRDIVAWNAMIAAFSFHALHAETMHLVAQMLQAGIAPNSSTLVSVLPTIGQANALRQGRAIHSYCLRKYLCDNVVLATALLDMYAKCHHLSYARKIFNTVNQKNEICWTAMIAGYVLHHSMPDALALYDDMLCIYNLNPTPATLATVLRACAQLTDLKKGKNLHCHMIKSGIHLDTTVGNSLISMYAKCGIMDDAAAFLDEMASKDPVSYSAIISGCVQNGYAEKALLIFRQMQSLGIEPHLETMIALLPACSHLAALQHGNCCHGYAVVRGFTSINNKLQELLVEMKKLGYQADSSFALHDVEEEEKEQILLYHSEKIAIAFGILHTSPSNRILVTKNLRICSDCHSAIKFITLLTEREITVRDVSRFHHFKNGMCNCQDFW